MQILTVLYQVNLYFVIFNIRQYNYFISLLNFTHFDINNMLFVIISIGSYCVKDVTSLAVYRRAS